MDIKELNLDWSEETRVQTKYGIKFLSKAEPTGEFWARWRSDKEELKKAGISVSKNRDEEWEVCYWRSLTDEEKQEIEEKIEASKASDADIEIPCPKGLEFYPFQKAAIKYAIERKHILIADSMGLGKTLESLGILNYDSSIYRVLVVCPASLRLNWKKEAEKWLIRKFNVGVVDRSFYPEGANFVIINYDVLQKHHDKLREEEWDIVILDELHYLKNNSSIRCRQVFGCRANKKKDIEAVKSIPTKKFVGLTGTPILNRPEELWTIVKAFDKEGLGRSWKGFHKRYCNAYQDRYGWNTKGASNLDELQLRLRESFMIRRLKEDVLPELPAKIRQVIELPTNGSQELVKKELEAYTKRQEKVAELKAKVELSKASDNEEEYKEAVAALKEGTMAIFSEMASLRQEVALAKVPIVIEYLKNALEQGPVVCFAHHKEVVRQIHEAFKDNSRCLVGDTKIEDRQKAVDDFQSGEYDLFIGSIKAAGVGITLTRSSHVVFAELDWTPAMINQSEDRCHRISQENSVLVQHLVLEESLDAYIAKTIVNKQNVIDQALDKGDILNVIKSEPILPFISKDKKDVSSTQTEIEKEAETITQDQITAILNGLQILASVCDGAISEDQMGFNSVDTHIGKALAVQGFLTPKQAVIGKKLVRKYRRQLSEEILEKAGIE